MRVFVTGGTGFVGSHVVERLVDRGHDPLCLIRKTSNTAHLDELGVDTHVGSLADVQTMRAAVEDADAVVHIAGVIKVREFDDFYTINGEATGELGRLAAEVNPDLERFVYVSSVSAQGPSDGPEPRPHDRTPQPVSHYGRSKLLGEERLEPLVDALPLTIFRPPPVYGPRDYEMLAAFQMAKYGIAPVYGDGEGYLSLIHVHDLARAIVKALEADHPSGSVFAIDDGEVHTWKTLTRDFGRAMGKEPRHVCVPRVLFHAAGHVSEAFGRLTNRATIFNTDKVAEMAQGSWVCGSVQLRELLDWQPRWPIEKGARQTAEWYLEEGWI
ncbi:NAD(P)-dependent oxidoreductase [Persicimonas caeni]|uniref:NAD(P)-dependent oxidoreductase n=1 Tax=Persicimonas caeni TaxID=2292766 RepID=A0A4Y6PY14_PERCE|nr:NAD(P)-dependent oxidoreductase [Persicimonas caeni]QDG53130.1 NAD(P)-dependent oxidoreductase [Persicimonas caeni]QED34352.1 NAD(P)-dependent oxidoreductase [Persicimonas caeni]